MVVTREIISASPKVKFYCYLADEYLKNSPRVLFRTPVYLSYYHWQTTEWWIRKPKRVKRMIDSSSFRACYLSFWFLATPSYRIMKS